MLNKKCFGAVILAAVAVSPSAFAGDRGTNTAVGGVLGAAIGASVGGGGGALVGGVLGAAVGNSLSSNDDHRYYNNRGYASVDYYNQPRPVYVQPRPVYVEPRPVYVQPRPVYVEQRYYSEPAVVYVERRGHRHGWGHRDRGYRDYNRDGYRDGYRDYDGYRR